MTSSESRPVHIVRIGVAGFMLFMLTNPLQLMIKGITPGATVLTDPHTSRVIYSNVILQMFVKAAVLAVFALAALIRPREGAAVLFRTPFLCAFVVYVCASVGWSDTPGNSLNDIVYLLTAITAGIAMAVHFNSFDCARIFAVCGLIIGIVSFITIIFFPVYGVHQSTEVAAGDLAGAWRGVYAHKNALGQIMAMYVVVYAFAGNRLLGSRYAQLSASALAIFIVLRSGSASAIILVAVGAAGYIVVFLLRGALQISTLILLPIAVMVSQPLKEYALDLLGRRADLSGRTEIWEAAYRMFLARPLIGYGYGSATLGGFTPYIISRFKAVNPHNGYIELALSSGLIGSLILYSGIALAAYRMKRAYAGSGPTKTMVQTFGAFFMIWSIANFSEISMAPSSPLGALGFMVIVICSSLVAPIDHDRVCC